MSFISVVFRVYNLSKKQIIARHPPAPVPINNSSDARNFKKDLIQVPLWKTWMDERILLRRFSCLVSPPNFVPVVTPHLVKASIRKCELNRIIIESYPHVNHHFDYWMRLTANFYMLMRDSDTFWHFNVLSLLTRNNDTHKKSKQIEQDGQVAE
jgi:hypothetical protein